MHQSYKAGPESGTGSSSHRYEGPLAGGPGTFISDVSVRLSAGSTNPPFSAALSNGYAAGSASRHAHSEGKRRPGTVVRVLILSCAAVGTLLRQRPASAKGTKA